MEATPDNLEPLATLDPRLEGYRLWEDSVDPFEDHIGPLYYTEDGNGGHKAAFIAERKNCNGAGILHGGMLMSFADYALFVIARDELQGSYAVTVSFSSEFVAAAEEDCFVEARGEVVRATGSMVFIRGQVFTGETVLLNFSGIIKKWKREK